MNGIEAVQEIRDSLPAVHFIFLTMHSAKGYRIEAQSLGAGYVLKAAVREQLNYAIQAAMTGFVKHPSSSCNT
jgi:DNA-binding NarL/FixJ family response regulator